MNYNLSACVFIRNATQGFCLWESLASLLHLASEFVIMDCGSTDGTVGLLREVAEANPKIKVILRDSFPTIDAGVFATLANELIDFCHSDNVLYYQADEIWHDDLLELTRQRLEAGQFDLSFWRIQYANNFQYVKWFPHVVHRVGQKGRFNFVGDGMNSDRYNEPPMVSQWDRKYAMGWDDRDEAGNVTEHYPGWGERGHDGIRPFVHEMITDISMIGGFRDNIPERRRLHAPFWHEEPWIPYHDKETSKQHPMQASAWIEKAVNDPDWTRPESPYNLPKILRYHVGKTRYELRPELLRAIKDDTTWNYLLNLG